MSEILQKLGVSEAFLRLLFSRGYNTLESINKFLFPKYEHLRSPFEFKEMDVSVDRIIKAIENKEKIVIVGHDDADGITATCVLYSVIKNLNGNVAFYIPKNKLEKIEIDANLIITVDYGTSGSNILSSADIIITDHHEIINTKPVCYSFINPKLNYPFPYLSGVGVSYKLAQGLAMRRLKINEKQWFSVAKNLLLFVTIGTIADKVELVDENRTFVKLYNGDFSSIYNTIGIISSAKGICPDMGVKFLLTQDSSILDKLNEIKEDKIIKIEETYKRCLFSMEKINPDASCVGIIYVYDDSLDENLIGVCASRIMSQKNLPTIIITNSRIKPNEYIVGEARSPEYFDLIKFFYEVDNLFINWGGHKHACGFVMKRENLQELKNYINIVKFYMPTKKIKIDCEIYTDEINDKFIEEIKLLEPYGEGNHPPIFITKRIPASIVSQLFQYSNITSPQFSNLNVVWSIKQNKPEILQLERI